MNEKSVNMLEIKNLHATVGGKAILKGLNLTIESRADPRHHGSERRWKKHAG